MPNRSSSPARTRRRTASSCRATTPSGTGAARTSGSPPSPTTTTSGACRPTRLPTSCYLGRGGLRPGSRVVAHREAVPPVCSTAAYAAAHAQTLAGARRRTERADVSRPAAAQRGPGVVGRLVRGRRTPGRTAAPLRVRQLHLRAERRPPSIPPEARAAAELAGRARAPSPVAARPDGLTWRGPVTVAAREKDLDASARHSPEPLGLDSRMALIGAPAFPPGIDGWERPPGGG